MIGNVPLAEQQGGHTPNMPNQTKRSQFPSRAGGTNASVTLAVGLPETAGRLRARRSSLFTQTIIWVTGLICLAFLLASLAQAWSNSQLMQHVQTAQQQLQQTQPGILIPQHVVANNITIKYLHLILMGIQLTPILPLFLF